MWNLSPCDFWRGLCPNSFSPFTARSHLLFLHSFPKDGNLLSEISWFSSLSPLLPRPSISFISVSHTLLDFDTTSSSGSSPQCGLSSKKEPWQVDFKSTQFLGAKLLNPFTSPHGIFFIHPILNWTKPLLILTLVSRSAWCAFWWLAVGFFGAFLFWDPSDSLLLSSAFSCSSANAIKSCSYCLSSSTLYFEVHEDSLLPNVLHGLFSMVMVPLSFFILQVMACCCPIFPESSYTRFWYK